jgi:hypothetical protein
MNGPAAIAALGQNLTIFSIVEELERSGVYIPSRN